MDASGVAGCEGRGDDTEGEPVSELFTRAREKTPPPIRPPSVMATAIAFTAANKMACASLTSPESAAAVSRSNTDEMRKTGSRSF